MKSQTSYFSISQPLIRENLRRFWAIPAISFLIYFISGIFPILISYTKINIVANYINMSLTNMQPFYMAAHLVMPVITAVVLFRYLQNGSSATMMHALPFSRFKLYNSNLISGLILVLTPVILSGLIMLIIAKPAYEGWGDGPVNLALAVDVFTRSAILDWMWQSTMIILVVYAISVFAGLVTANSIMHFATALGFNFLIPALYAIFVFYFSTYLYGFNISGDWGTTCLSISPYLEVFNLSSDGGSFPASHQVYYLLNALILFVVSSFLYTKRKLEKATDSLAFDFMIPIICYLVAFFGMTLLGQWFREMNRDSRFYEFAGYVAGAFIFFIIGRMIVMKTPRVFNISSLKSFAIYVLIAVLFLTGLFFDVTGFEKRVPSAEKVTSVSLEDSFLMGSYNRYASGMYQDVPPGEFYRMGAVFTTSENIAAMTRLHASLLESRLTFEENQDNLIQYDLGFNYTLGGLNTLQRIYTVDYAFLKNSKDLKTLYESEEFKNMYSFKNLKYERINSINIYNQVNPVVITSPDQVAALLKMFDMDYRNETYAQVMSLELPLATANVNYKSKDPTTGRLMDNATDFVIRDSYTNTIGWLKENGYYDQLPLTEEMISSIGIFPPTSMEAGYKENYMGETEYAEQLDEFMITDKAQIAEIMKVAKSQSLSYTGYYYGTVYYNIPGQTEATGYESAQAIFFHPDEVPDFILSHFE